MSSNNGVEYNPVSLEEAKLLLEKDRADKVSQCSKEVQEILNKYNCTLVYQPVVISR